MALRRLLAIGIAAQVSAAVVPLNHAVAQPAAANIEGEASGAAADRSNDAISPPKPVNDQAGIMVEQRSDHAISFGVADYLARREQQLHASPSYGVQQNPDQQAEARQSARILNKPLAVTLAEQKDANAQAGQKTSNYEAEMRRVSRVTGIDYLSTVAQQDHAKAAQVTMIDPNGLIRQTPKTANWMPGASPPGARPGATSTPNASGLEANLLTALVRAVIVSLFSALLVALLTLRSRWGRRKRGGKRKSTDDQAAHAAADVSETQSDDVNRAVESVPQEALQEMLQHFEEISRQVAAKPNAPPWAAGEHRKWQALNGALRAGGVLALPRVRQGVHEALATSGSPKPLPFRYRRTLRLCLVGFVFWSAFVLYRTEGSHELFGIDLDRWDEGALFTNWLGVPAVAAFVLLACRWALAGRVPTLKGLLKHLPLKRPAELTPEEEGALGGFGLFLVPVGLALAGYGLMQADPPATLIGLVVAISPFLLLIRLPGEP